MASRFAARKRLRPEILGVSLSATQKEILSTLEDFKNEELERFQWHLSEKVMSEFDAIPKSHLENKTRDETVDEMVAFHTEDRAVKVAVEILKQLSLHDAAKTLREKYTSAKMEDGTRCTSTTTDLLLCTLEELGGEDFKRFRQQLSQKLVIVSEAIPRGLLENKTREQTVDLMVGAHTEDGALNVAAEILKLMSLHNAAKTLVLGKRNVDVRMDLKRLRLLLVKTLNDINHEHLKLFQRKLYQPTMIGFEAIPRGLLENKSREETVDLMVAYYTDDGAVTVMVEILKRIGQRNAAMKLQKEYRAVCQTDGTVSLTFISRW